jgi:shikimate dehydrogenase
MSSIHNLSQFLESECTETPFAAVLGNPIAHSLSPLIHNMAFQSHGLDITYYPVLVNADEYDFLPNLFSHENFIGANVTIPLKSVVINYLTDQDSTVSKTGACNTVYINEKGTVSGANTDIQGFLSPLIEFKQKLVGKNAIIFGTGGASKAISAALQAFGMDHIYLVSRSGEPSTTTQKNNVLSYMNWTSKLSDVVLIVNSTPTGMHPDVLKSPVRDDQITFLRNKICYDIIYNPFETLFLQQAKQSGCPTINGLPMFIGQAAASFQLFCGKVFPSPEAEVLVKNHMNIAH